MKYGKKDDWFVHSCISLKESEMGKRQNIYTQLGVRFSTA